MQYQHRGKKPSVHPTAFIAPSAVVAGDVTVGENSCILHGAVVTSQGGPIRIGANCVIMENAVVRGTRRHPTTIGDNCLLGPTGYVSGATVEDNVFLATGCAVFNGACVGERSTVRIHGVVHVNTVLGADTTIPIGWVAVGAPAVIRPAEDHDEIWAVQRTLDFPGTVFGVERAPAGETRMPEMMRRYCRALLADRDDTRVAD